MIIRLLRNKIARQIESIDLDKLNALGMRMKAAEMARGIRYTRRKSDKEFKNRRKGMK